VDVAVQVIEEPETLRGDGDGRLYGRGDAPETKASGRTRGFCRGAELTQIEQELQHAARNATHREERCRPRRTELKSSNEELQSANEELQSTNEELTTSGRDAVLTRNCKRSTRAAAKVDDWSRRTTT